MEGIFAIVSPDDCIVQLYDSVFRLQHRGQGYCGIATASKRGIKMNTRKGLVAQTLEEELGGLRGKLENVSKAIGISSELLCLECFL